MQPICAGMYKLMLMFRIQGLFLFVAGFLLSINSNAGIIFTDIDFRQNNPLTTDWTKSVDVNHDGVTDFTFSGNFFYHDLLLEQEANMALCVEHGEIGLHFFQRNDSIGAPLSYDMGSFLLVHMDTLHMPVNMLTYIGFEFMDELSGAVYYGWISMKLDIFHKIFYLYEAAMQETDGKSIAAGQTGVGFSENPLQHIQIRYSGNGLFFESLPEDFRGTVYVYDLSGKLQVYCDITFSQKTIAITPKDEMAILVLISEHQWTTRKLLLSSRKKE